MSLLLTRAEIEALRSEVRASTGPVTDAGKAVSSRNAMTHGLSGSGLLLPDVEAQRARDVEFGLRDELRPVKESEDLLIKQMAVHHVKAEQARALQREIRRKIADRADAAWSNDRRIEALDVAAKLGEHPEKVVTTLLASVEGARWMASRWGGLRNKAARGDMWDEADRKLALDLLAFPPVYREKILPDETDNPDPAALLAHYFQLADRELGNIRFLINTKLTQLDESDLDRAARGVETYDNRELRLFRRYERDAQRRFEWAWSEFHKRRRDEAVPDSSPADSDSEVHLEADPLDEVENEVIEEVLDEYVPVVDETEEEAEETEAEPAGVAVEPARRFEGNRRLRRKAEAELRRALKAQRRNE